jgi:transcriptional repressor NrdR
MQCPQCGLGSHLSVSETRRHEAAIRRRRNCGHCGHTFQTLEAVVGDTLRVEKSDGTLELLDRAKLLKGVTKASVRPHHADQLAELIELIVQSARRSADEATLTTTELADIVLERLKDFDPVTHVRYALTQLGRRDRPGRVGWKTVVDIRRWLRDEYPELEYFRPSSVTSTVVKRDGRREPFDRRKLERSIGVASKGRGDSDEAVRRLATWVADNVVGVLEHQSLVTSGQIASEILRVLRATDHVAALRFASTAKGFVSVEDYEAEALGLRDEKPGRR